MKYTVIMPVKYDDLHLVEMNYRRIKKYVDSDRIVVVTNTTGIEHVNRIGSNVDIIDENYMYNGLSFTAVKEEMLAAGLDPKLTGHCFQQLLKMAFCFVNRTEGYLVWDADTIPTRYVPFYNSLTRKYIFYMKGEYTRTYFNHLYKLLGIKKQVKKSFISEHMYFINNIMAEIVTAIQNNNSITGKTWWQKVVRAMETGNGMSEYEIYGNYVISKYPGLYEMKDSLSLRYGRNVLGTNPSDEQLLWMSQKFDAVSIENFDNETFLTNLSSSKWIRNNFDPEQYAKIVSFINRSINRIKKV